MQESSLPATLSQISSSLVLRSQAQLKTAPAADVFFVPAAINN